MSSAAEKCLPQSSLSRKISRSENPSPSTRRDSGSKEELSQATAREIFQSRILDRGGKLLTVGGHMIALVERGREMPSQIQLFTENLAKRKLLFFLPLGLRVERGAFSGNIARDIPKLGFEFVFSAVTLSYALLRESTARWTLRNFSISNPKPGPRGKLLTVGGHMIALVERV